MEQQEAQPQPHAQQQQSQQQQQPHQHQRNQMILQQQQQQQNIQHQQLQQQHNFLPVAGQQYNSQQRQQLHDSKYHQKTSIIRFIVVALKRLANPDEEQKLKALTQELMLARKQGALVDPLKELVNRARFILGEEKVRKAISQLHSAQNQNRPKKSQTELENEAVRVVESTENVETHLDHDLKSQFKRDPNALDQTLNTVDVIDEDVEMSNLFEVTQAVNHAFSLEAPSTSRMLVFERHDCAARLEARASFARLRLGMCGTSTTTTQGGLLQTDTAHFLSQAVQIYLVSLLTGAHRFARQRLNVAVNQFGEFGQRGRSSLYEYVTNKILTGDGALKSEGHKDEKIQHTKMMNANGEHENTNNKNNPFFELEQRMLARGELDVINAAKVHRSICVTCADANDLASDGKSLKKRKREDPTLDVAGNGTTPSLLERHHKSTTELSVLALDVERFSQFLNSR